MLRGYFTCLPLALLGCGATELLVTEGDPAVFDDARDSTIADTRRAPEDVAVEVARDSTAVIEVGDAISEHPVDCGPAPATLSDHQVFYLAIDATHVYFTDADGVKKVSRCGGETTTLLAHSWLEEGSAGRIVAYGDDVFVALVPSSFGKEGAIVRIPKRGGDPVVLVATKSGNSPSLGIDEGSLYWSDDGLKRQPLGGGAPVELTAYASGPFTFDTTRVFLTSPVGYVLKTGGLVKELARDGASCATADDAFIYWTSRLEKDTVSKAAIVDFGTPSSESITLATTSSVEGCLALDGDWVYWADGLGVSRVRKTGGSAELVAAGPATELALDAYHVFFATYAGLFRARKPSP